MHYPTKAAYNIGDTTIALPKRIPGAGPFDLLQITEIHPDGTYTVVLADQPTTVVGTSITADAMQPANR